MKKIFTYNFRDILSYYYLELERFDKNEKIQQKGWSESPVLQKCLQVVFFSLQLFGLVCGLVLLFYNKVRWVSLLFFIILPILFSFFSIIKSYHKIWVEGLYKKKLKNTYYWAFCMFIWSEVFLFRGFFWSLGYSWKMTIKDNLKHISHIDPLSLPLLGTFLLLFSAITLGWYEKEQKKGDFFWLKVTIFLGLSFVCVQIIEYGSLGFHHGMGVFPSVFYSITCLHGFHVFIGVCFFIYIIKVHVSYTKYFYGAVLYWHFVDLVWLVVYSCGYLLFPYSV